MSANVSHSKQRAIRYYITDSVEMKKLENMQEVYWRPLVCERERGVTREGRENVCECCEPYVVIHS